MHQRSCRDLNTGYFSARLSPRNGNSSLRLRAPDFVDHIPGSMRESLRDFILRGSRGPCLRFHCVFVRVTLTELLLMCFFMEHEIDPLQLIMIYRKCTRCYKWELVIESCNFSYCCCHIGLAVKCYRLESRFKRILFFLRRIHRNGSIHTTIQSRELTFKTMIPNKERFPPQWTKTWGPRPRAAVGALLAETSVTVLDLERNSTGLPHFLWSDCPRLHFRKFTWTVKAKPSVCATNSARSR